MGRVHGDEQFKFRRHLNSIMKYLIALLFLAALAIAEPESEAKADPAADAWYGYYGYPGYYGHRYYGYGGYYGHRYGYGYWGRKKREADPAVLASSSALTAPQTVDLPLVHPYAYGVGAPLLHAAVPHTYTVGPATVEHTPGTVEVKAHAPVVYAGHYGCPYGGWGYGYGVPLLAAPAAAEAVTEERKKRDAEPEADAAADAWYGYYGYGRRYYGGYYGGYYGHPYGYGYRYWG